MTSIVDVVLTIINESEDLVEQYESSIDDSVLEAINVKLKELSEKSSKLKEIIKLVLSNILPLSYRLVCVKQYYFY